MIISSTQEEPENNRNIMNEFANFTQSLNKIDRQQEPSSPASTSHIETSNSSENFPIVAAYLRNHHNPTNNFDQLHLKLDRIYEQFRLIVNEQFILHTQNATKSHSIRKNMSLESKFQVIRPFAFPLLTYNIIYIYLHCTFFFYFFFFCSFFI